MKPFTALFIPTILLTSAGVQGHLDAQWIKYPTAGLPRDAQGRFDPKAAAPRMGGKPDFSGFWTMSPSMGYSANVTTDLVPADIQPAAAALSRKRLENFGIEDPETVGCLPGGPRHILGAGVAGLVKIIQTPLEIVIMYEDLSYRQVFLDGRPLPDDPNPTWMGYSVGHWEGDALVVESAGFNDRTWLDFAGHPHSEALRIRERYRRPSFGTIERQVTFDDPKTYAKPWSIASNGRLTPDTELIESVCENERDRVHLLGRTEDEKVVKVPVAVLAEYAGRYEVPSATAFDGGGASTVFEIALVGEELQIDFQGQGKVPMIPLSQTTFSPRLLGTFEFVRTNGKVTHMFVHSAEEVLRAEKKR